MITVTGPTDVQALASIDAFSGESCVSPKSGLGAHRFQNTRRQQSELKGSGIWCHIKEELLSKDRKEQNTRVMTERIAA